MVCIALFEAIGELQRKGWQTSGLFLQLKRWVLQGQQKWGGGGVILDLEPDLICNIISWAKIFSILGSQVKASLLQVVEKTEGSC